MTTISSFSSPYQGSLIMRRTDASAFSSTPNSAYSRPGDVSQSATSENSPKNSAQTPKASENTAIRGNSETASSEQFSNEELVELQHLQKRDAEVKAHEQAHLSNAGQYAAGSASFTYQTGPDGRKYAIGGEVPIDISKENTPEETIAKMEQVARAAMAPAVPSAADRRIAARAAVIEAEARSSLREEESTDSIYQVNGLSIAGEYSDNSRTSSSEITNLSKNERQLAINAYLRAAA